MKARGKFWPACWVQPHCCSRAAPSQAGEFDGVTVNVITQTGAIQEPLQRRAPEFEKLTGAKINVIAVPFSDLYQKVADRLGERHQLGRRRGLRAAVDGRLCRRRLSRGPDAAIDADKDIEQEDVGAVLPRLLARSTTARPTWSRSMATST